MGRMRTTLIAAGAAAAVGVGATTVPGLAASGSSTTPSPTGKASTNDPRSEYEAALARRLGTTVAKLQDAEKGARDDVFVAHLDDMVAHGAISKEDAATLKAAAANGTLDAAMRKLQRARLEKELAARVKDGVITQDQADAILKDFDANGGGRGFGMGPMGMGGDGPGRMGGPGRGFGDHHGRGGGWFGGGGAPSAPQGSQGGSQATPPGGASFVLPGDGPQA